MTKAKAQAIAALIGGRALQQCVGDGVKDSDPTWFVSVGDAALNLWIDATGWGLIKKGGLGDSLDTYGGDWKRQHWLVNE